MNKKERIKFIIEELEKKYPKVPIPLDHKDPYTLLIAVLLSAQCTDVRVNKITPILFKRADNPYDMVKMSVEEIKDIKNIIYISCGFESFVRDLNELRATHKIVRTAMFDQFPYTDHIESGAILERITPV